MFVVLQPDDHVTPVWTLLLQKNSKITFGGFNYFPKRS